MYYPLHEQEIRLVDILPGAWKDEIRCILRQASVSNNPNYKALSYVWGALKATRRPIVVDGHPHLVTANLEFALRRIRQHGTVTTFWIDALSINQDDNAERSTQVGMMRNIYARASVVVIYLGEAPHHDFAGCPSKSRHPTSLSLFHCDSGDAGVLSDFKNRCFQKDSRNGSSSKKKLNYAHEACCLLSLMAQTSDLESIPPFDEESRPHLDSFYQRNVFEALRYLMRSNWWDRIWVVQEIVVPKNIILLYDTTTAPWDMFVKAAQAYAKGSSSLILSSFPREYSDVLLLFSRIVLDIYHMRCRWEKAEITSLLSLLRQFSNRKASDDRDKVYALLGLIRHGDVSDTSAASLDLSIVSPDYSLDTVAVFKNTVLSIIEPTGSLSILAGNLGRKNRQDLPSWAVDWSATSDDVDRRRAEDTEKYNASAGTIVLTNRFGKSSLRGVSRYLKQISELEVKTRAAPSTSSPQPNFTFDLSSSNWQKYCVTPGTQQSDAERLDAIEHYLAIHNGIARLRELENVLDCPGLYKGRVVATGSPSFSHDDFEYLVKAWGSTISFYSENMNRSHSRVKNLDEAFVRTLCADVVNTDGDDSGANRRRATETEVEEIVSWIWQLGGLPGPDGLWEKLSKEQSLDVSTGHPRISPNMLASIRIATYKRRLFITDTGFIGIGPVGIQAGDKLYLLLGGRAPFILRESSTQKVPLIANRPGLGLVDKICFELVGDCYAHGLMDGEGMETWKDAATMSFHHSKAQLHVSLRDFEHWRTIQEDVYQGHSVVDAFKTPDFRTWVNKLQYLRVNGDDLEMKDARGDISTEVLLRRLKRVESENRAWLERHELMTWIETIDMEDSFRMVKETVTKLDKDLQLALEKLNYARMDLLQSELGIEHQTRVHIV